MAITCSAAAVNADEWYSEDECVSEYQKVISDVMDDPMAISRGGLLRIARVLKFYKSPNPKVTLLCYSAAVGFNYWLAEHFSDLKQFVRGGCRVARTYATAYQLCWDYRAQFKIDDAEEREASMQVCHMRNALRLLDLCKTNGGLFVKFAQHLAGQDRILPREFCSTLKTLQDKAAFSSLSEINTVFMEDLGTTFPSLFSEFSAEPVGSASIGQVHVARLRSTGEQVAVKIQHPSVKQDSAYDLAAFRMSLDLIAKKVPSFDVGWLADELEKHLHRELDFKMEAANAERTRRLLQKFGVTGVKVPKVYTELSSRRILVMEYCPGVRITDGEALEKMGIDPVEVVQRMWMLFATMIFKGGFVHADPHPGNILVEKTEHGWNLILLDHGIYEHVAQVHQLYFANLCYAMLRHDESALNSLAEQFGLPSHRVLYDLVRHPDRFTAEHLNVQTAKNVARAIREDVPRPLLLLLGLNEMLMANERALRPFFRPHQREGGLRSSPAVPVYLRHCAWFLRQPHMPSSWGILDFWYSDWLAWYLDVSYGRKP